jgi:hypothetical protein
MNKTKLDIAYEKYCDSFKSELPHIMDDGYPITKELFVEKLKYNDWFGNKWGQDCTQELTKEELIDLGKDALLSETAERRAHRLANKIEFFSTYPLPKRKIIE